MKFPTIALSATVLFALSATAQRIAIGYPRNNSTVSAGSPLLIEVDKPNSLSGSTEVAIVIGLNRCQPNNHCNPPEIYGMGSILYNGPYAPQYSNTSWQKPPHQNFTVTLPSTVAGTALLTVYHVNLIGANRAPFTEFANLTLNVLA